MMTSGKTQEELSAELGQFTGTTQYYLHEMISSLVVLTDGAYYLREKAACYWLFDILVSVQHLLLAHDSWLFGLELTRDDEENRAFTLRIDDGNDNLIYKQEISYSDFPLDEIKMFIGKQPGVEVRGADKTVLVAMLPSEY